MKKWDTYHVGEQWRLRRACVSAQSRQRLRCLLTHYRELEEASDKETNWATSGENLFMPHANNKVADQPALPRSLFSVFAIRCLDSIIPQVSISEISSLSLVSVAEQAGLNLTMSQTPKTGFLVTRLSLCHLWPYTGPEWQDHDWIWRVWKISDRPNLRSNWATSRENLSSRFPTR